MLTSLPRGVNNVATIQNLGNLDEVRVLFRLSAIVFLLLI